MNNTEWVRDWFGYQRHISTIHEPEQPCEEEIKWFKWIVGELRKSGRVVLYEIGSGYGPWSMALASLRNGSGYKCIAVEANPDYVQLTKDHLEGQKVNCTIINAAISDHVGTCRFNTDYIPFGQAITLTGRIKGSRILGIIWGLGHIITRHTARVNMFTLDYLSEQMPSDHIDILQMDIQGAEVKAIVGAQDLINHNQISYIMIGTHHKSLNAELSKMLSERYVNLCDILPMHGKDGLQVWKHKRI
jgi:FkbM family methyltransferase